MTTTTPDPETLRARAAEIAALVERCEKAKGPDRELDCLIAAAMGYEQDGTQYSVARYIAGCGLDWLVTQADSHNSVFRELPRYTASIDAAKTLVPEGVRPWHVGVNPKGVCSAIVGYGQTSAATPELALCAAALRAHLNGDQP